MILKFKYFLPVTILAVMLVFTSCKKDDPDPPNQEEIITTVNYTLTPTSGGTTVVMTFQDLDGDGPNTPIISGGTLVAGETYSGSLELLNETENPAEDITTEIMDEDDEHQFFFSSTVTGLSIAYNDQDGNGNPVGLLSTLTTGAAATGTVTIILLHEPVKTASGVSGGDPTNAEGETDIEVTFPVNVQ